MFSKATEGCGRSGQWKALAAIMMETDKQAERLASKSPALRSWLWVKEKKNKSENNSPYVMNVKEMVGLDRRIQETVVMISQPGINLENTWSRAEITWEIRREVGGPAQFWLEQVAWLDQTELQYRVQSIHILLFLLHIEKQMEFFFSPVKSCHMSTSKKSPGGHVGSSVVFFSWVAEVGRRPITFAVVS